VIIRRVEIANRRAGGLWWRIPAALILWAPIAVAAMATAMVVAQIRDHARDLPAVPSLERWRDAAPRTTTLRAADGTVLAAIPFTDGQVIGHRHWVDYADIPPLMIGAILAAEDLRFFSHPGVDAHAVVRAALANYRAGEIVEGASTITQQLARNLLPEAIGDRRSVRRKVREAIMARRIERAHSKQDILEVYANLIFLGAQSYGVAAAAERYFGKTLAELEAGEAAMIAGLAQAPGRADPNVDGAAARARRDHVLARMREAGLLDELGYRAAAAAPIELSPAPPTYGALAPWLTERIRRQLAEDSGAAFRRGGLVVDTAVEPALAIEATARARRHTDRLAGAEGPPEVAALIWDHRTGYLEMTVGGRDFAASQFDRTYQACRQPGSAFKPILYGAALEAGAITPGTPLRDGPIAVWDDELGVHWKPRNEGRAFRGVALAQDALASSLNAPAIDVLDRAGTKRVVRFARRLGITTELAGVRPLALGASCVIPLELAGVFATIAAGGRALEPIAVTRIRRGDEVLLDRAHVADPALDPSRRLDRLAAVAALRRGDPLIGEEVAFQLASMLRDVVRRGTGTAAAAVGRPAAGKTGTTNENSDAWFIGFTGRVVGAVWIGHDDQARRLPRGADGSRAALPLWVELVAAAEGRRSPRPVPGAPPAGLVARAVDRETGALAEPGGGGAIELYFVRGTEPTTRAGARSDVPVDLGRVSREF
jgi:penicillin-binding protein 1A